MANKNIKEVESGELTALLGSEGIETDDGAASNWVQAINLHQMLQGVGLVNGRILPSVASNNLTLAVKHRDGSDPSASKPVGIYLAGSLRIISAPLSVSAPAGTNYCNLGGNETKTIETDLFAYLSWRTLTSAVVLGFSRYPGAKLYSDLNATTTNEKGAPFNATPASTDEVTVIGRFAATLSGGAGFTWSVPAYTAANLVTRPIYETRMLTFTPTITAFSGTFTTVSATGAYKIGLFGVYIQTQITDTNNGTAGGFIKSSTPVSMSASSAPGVGITAAGKACIANPSAALFNVFLYDATYPGATGQTINLGGLVDW